MTNFDEIANLGHEDDPKIELPLLFFGNQSQQMRHIVVSLLQVIQSTIDSVPDADGAEVQSWLEGSQQFNQLLPTRIIHILSHYRGSSFDVDQLSDLQHSF